MPATLVLSVEYALAPYDDGPNPNDAPRAVKDALAAFDDVVGRAAEFGADPARISVGGDSAGGNLSAVVSQQRRGAALPPSAQLLIYPATDGSERSESYESRELFGKGLAITLADFEAFGRYYIGASGIPHDDPRVSPLCAEDFGGLPPALVVVAGFDLLRDDGEKYFERLKSAAAEVDGDAAARDFRRLSFDTLTHGFVHMTGVCPSALDAMVKIGREWRELLDGAGR